MDSRTNPGQVFRTRLQRILLEEGRRQSWLAAAVDVHPSRLNLYVKGLPIDDEGLRQRIATALRRTTTDVFETPIDAPLDDALPEAA